MTQKHKIAKAVLQELSKFVGQPNTQFTRDCIKEDLTGLLMKFSKDMGFRSQLPSVVVEINGTSAAVSIVDPRTGETISLSEWVTRGEGGFYG